MLPVIVYEGIGYLMIWQGQKAAEKFTPWYIDAGIVLGTGYSSSRGYVIGRHMQPVAQALGRHTVGAISKIAQAVASPGRMAVSRMPKRIPLPSASLAATAGMYVSAATAGYMIGAVAGTAIGHTIWGDSGARHALDFYTGQGKYGEYFDIVGNVNTIYNAYQSGNL